VLLGRGHFALIVRLRVLLQGESAKSGMWSSGSRATLALQG